MILTKMHQDCCARGTRKADRSSMLAQESVWPLRVPGNTSFIVTKCLVVTIKLHGSGSFFSEQSKSPEAL